MTVFSYSSRESFVPKHCAAKILLLILFLYIFSLPRATFFFEMLDTIISVFETLKNEILQSPLK